MSGNHEFESRSSVITLLSPLTCAHQIPYTMFLFFPPFCVSPGKVEWKKPLRIPWHEFPLIDLTNNKLSLGIVYDYVLGTPETDMVACPPISAPHVYLISSGKRIKFNKL